MASGMDAGANVLRFRQGQMSTDGTGGNEGPRGVRQTVHGVADSRSGLSAELDGAAGAGLFQTALRVLAPRDGRFSAPQADDGSVWD